MAITRILDRRLASLTLIAINLAIAALLAVTVWLVARTSHQAYESSARETAAHLVGIAQANVAAEFARVDTLMLAALHELEARQAVRPMSDAAINETLDAHRHLQPALEGLRLTDAAGRVRWGNDLPAGPPLLLPFPEALAAAAREPARTPLVFGPVPSPTSDHMVVAVVRPLHSGGRFLGHLYATVSLEHFRTIFSSYALDAQDAISLRTRPQLTLLVRHADTGGAGSIAGSSTVSAEFAAAFHSSPTHGSFSPEIPLDGVRRTNAYRSVEGWPLVVIAGLSNERFFAPWRRQTQQVALLALLAWGIVAAATVVIRRVLQGQAQTLRKLAAQTSRVQAMLHVTADGVHILDRTGHLLAMSDSFARMLGTTPAALLGRHVSTWDVRDSTYLSNWLAQAKDGDTVRRELQHRRADGTLIDVELQLAVAEIDGELLHFGSTRDITEQRRLQASLAESSARVRDLYDHAPCGYYSLDHNGVVVHANQTMLEWLGMREDEVIGKLYFPDVMDEAGQALFAQKFPELKAEQQPLDGLEHWLVTRAGCTRYLRTSVTAAVDADGVFQMSRSVALDITALHQAQQQAERLLRDQAAMLDNDIVGMVKVQNRAVVWSNRAVERVFGYGVGELIGTSTRLLHVDDATHEALGTQAYPQLQAGLNVRTQMPMRHKDGHVIWIDVSGVKLSGDMTFWMLADITAMKESQANIEHIAFHDALTQLPNRLLLQDRLQQALAGCERNGSSLAVCYLDLDGFKGVNDVHGHDAGDTLLREIARRLASTLRAHDTAARLGGDEFVLVLTALQDADEWRPVVERAMAAVRVPVQLPNGVEVRVGTTIGVALAPHDSADPQTLLDLADHAMLRAKRAGKGVIELARSRPVGVLS